MTSTYTLNQGIEKPAAGDQSGTWGGTVNTNMDIIDRVVSGVGALTLTGSTTTLTTTDGTLTDGMYRVLVLGDGGDVGSDNTITISPNDQDKLYLVYNNLTANRNAIFTQGSGANATVENGETAWIYADGAGSGAAVRVATSSTKLLDQDGDTGIRVEEGGDDDDTIRFDIAGAEDFTMSANTFTALSGSTVAIASGATITNSGTATGFGADAERAMAGVLQANANFVDQVIFGPAVDGVPWNGFWDKAGVYSSLMLATIEDEGSNTEINIWDLTQQSAGVISTTPLATVDLANLSVPTSVAASMGYIIVGGEDGIHIIDPHSGAWAERTTGWPKSLTASTGPALTNADVTAVAAGLSSASPLDPRTGGPLPVFACAYGTGADVGSLIKYDGNVFDFAGTIGPENVAGFVDDRIAVARENSGNQVLLSTLPINAIIADDWGVVAYSGDNNTQQFSLGANTAATFHNADAVFADTTGLTIRRNDFIGSTSAAQGVSAMINRTFNSGFLINFTKGAWLANSKTLDRSGNANTLTENGTVTEGVVETSAELLGYSGWTGENYMERAHDADLDFGTASFMVMAWVKTTSMSSDFDIIFQNEDPSGTTAREFALRWEADGALGFGIGDGAAGKLADTGVAFDDGVWHLAVGIKLDTTNCLIYVDGVLLNAVGSGLSNTLTDANAVFRIGRQPQGGSGASDGRPNENGTTALVRISTTIPTATQIREIYDAEKGMFVASAECLLQSGSTDAVIDVDIDPLSSKVIVTQTDAITIFDGLVVDSKPTVNSGASEKGKLWGDLRAEQNAANAYVTAPATDQRQVNEMVRSLASDLPAGPDLSKAAAWAVLNKSGDTLDASLNIKSVAFSSTGYMVATLAIPVKTGPRTPCAVVSVALGGASGNFGITGQIDDNDIAAGLNGRIAIRTSNQSNAAANMQVINLIVFGELENE